MALSQKHPGKMLVPWFNTNEWKMVKDLIFDPSNSNAQKQEAFEILKMWKLRTPRLPSGVEGTLILLEALLQNTDELTDNNLRILYGASIMRYLKLLFLNLCGANKEKQGTFYQTARRNNLPDWLIDLRHDVAHDQILPSKFMLLRGLEFCLDWIKSNYWGAQAATLRDFVISADNNQEMKLSVKFYCHLNLLNSLNRDLNCLDDILKVDRWLHKEICAFNDFMQIDLSVCIDDLLQELLHVMGVLVLKTQKKQKLAELIAEVVILSGSIFDTEFLVLSDGKEQLPRDFVNIWQDLFDLLYTNNMLLPLIEKFLNLTSDADVIEHNRRIASFWLAELFKSLLLTKNINEHYNNSIISAGNRNFLNLETARTILEKTIIKENPEWKECLTFDFQICQDVIEGIRPLQSRALSNPNGFTLNFSKYLLELCDCSKDDVDAKELKVTRFVLHRGMPILDTDVVHTSNKQFNGLSEAQEVVDSDEPLNAMNGNTLAVESEVAALDIDDDNEIKPPRIKVRILEDTSILAGCPLGVLPGQSRDFNPLR